MPANRSIRENPIFHRVTILSLNLLTTDGELLPIEMTNLRHIRREFAAGQCNASELIVVPSPSRGGVGVGMGVATWIKPIPTPTSPLQGKEFASHASTNKSQSE